MTDKNYKVIRCWRCAKSALVDMNTVTRDSRGRPLYACPKCTLAIEKLDKKGQS